MKDIGFKKILYRASLFFITVSGFAQMPIFKRYYIADIPGFGWLARFYVTHAVHYISAIVLTTLVSYLLTEFLLHRRAGLSQVTKTAYVKVSLLAGLIFTGGLLVYKNLPGVYMGHGLISILDLVHLGFCVLLLAAGFYSAAKKKNWLENT